MIPAPKKKKIENSIKALYQKNSYSTSNYLYVYHQCSVKLSVDNANRKMLSITRIVKIAMVATLEKHLEM